MGKDSTKYKFFSERSRELITQICVVRIGNTDDPTRTKRHVDWGKYAQLKSDLLKEHMTGMTPGSPEHFRASQTISHIQQLYGNRA